jgi:hypothetical protein
MTNIFVHFCFECKGVDEGKEDAEGTEGVDEDKEGTDKDKEGVDKEEDGVVQKDLSFLLYNSKNDWLGSSVNASIQNKSGTWARKA